MVFVLADCTGNNKRLPNVPNVHSKFYIFFLYDCKTLRMNGRRNLVKEKNTKSATWNFFVLKADEHSVSILSEEHRPICKICYKSMPCKSGNTTNLFAHLRERHPREYKQANQGLQGNKNRNEASRSQGVQPTLETVVECSTYYDPKGAQAKELNHAVAYFLAKDMQPLYMWKNLGFER